MLKFEILMFSDIQIVTHRPNTVLYYITNSCHLNCRHCAVSIDRRQNAIKELSTNNIKTLFLILKNSGIKTISITGGEPLLVRDIFDILSFAKKLGLKIDLNTSLTFLPDKFEEIISNRFIDKLFISIDGGDEETHDFIRGKGNFKRTIANLSLITDMNNSSKHNPFVNISFTSLIHKKNCRDIRSILDLGKKYKVDEINLEQLAIFGNAEINKHLLEIEKKELLDVYENIFLLKQSYYPFIIKTNYVANAFIDYFNKKYRKSEPYKYFACKSVSNFIYLSWEGIVSPCAVYCEQSGKREMSNELKKELNLFDNDLSTILNSSLFLSFLSFRSPSQVKKYYKSCSKCEFLGKLCNPCISMFLSGDKCNYDLCELALQVKHSLFL